MIVLGIDIGLTGAVAAVDSRGSCTVHDIETVEDGKGRRIDGRALVLLLRQLVPAGEAALVVHEDLHPRPMGNGNRQGNTMHSQGSLMQSKGLVQCALDVVRLEVKVVQPQAWKRFFGLIGKEKGDAREIAARLYPAVAHEFKRVKDHNRADAVLMANYGHGRLA